jgi:DNA-directed RNA polymerase II subunit RPB2
MESVSWDLINKYFKHNPYSLVAHHLDSFNKFFSNDIFNIFRENNPFQFVAKTTDGLGVSDKMLMYMGGRNADKIYFGKPVIYDLDNVHYMYPNEARLRNMTYGVAIHYDVDVDVYSYEEGVEKVKTVELKQIYLGTFPIMLHSNLCILKGLTTEARFNMGECRNDLGGYFIINGKEKSIICQESRADNMIYVLANESKDESEIYSHVAQIKSVSEDTSKPIRTTSVMMVAPNSRLTNMQIVVEIPNVKKHIPLFILMRALGVTTDQDIIKYCLLDLNKNEDFVDLFTPSVHDASIIFNQVNALKYIATFTKRQTISNTIEILMNAFLPHVGELNFLDKAYFVGYMVYKMLKVYKNQEQPTNRDNFKYKRIELSGALIYDLFREYYLLQKKQILLKIEKVDYFGRIDNLSDYLELNQSSIFKNRIVETGVRKAFKGNWGSQTNTKRVGVVQDLNRLSWNTFMCQLRRISLPLSSSAKVVGPHLLNNSQWGYIDPIDTPDGGNVGLHKHLAITCLVTSGYSSYPIIDFLKANTIHPLRSLQECTPEYLSAATKVIVNGNWIGVVDSPIELVKYLKVLRRNGIIPIYTSVTFDYEKNEIYIFTDSGRLTRPIYYVENKVVSFERLMERGAPEIMQSGAFKWSHVASGFYEKLDANYDIGRNKMYNDISELYSIPSSQQVMEVLTKNAALVDYIDVSEEENSLIAPSMEICKTNKYYTHVEIDPSLIFGIMGNSVIYPEHNPLPRNQFSCGQSKQAVSAYHSNAQVRFDKAGVFLNYGQTPLVKSRYLEHINKEEHPYGVNAMVAIMSHTGYNVEDATLINEASLKRGLFNTTYYTTYESHEETGANSTSTFSNVAKDPTVVGLNEKHDYNYLDEHGFVKENTEVNDKIVMIGKKTSDNNKQHMAKDESSLPKKGQLGVVDKVFVTDTTEGTRIAKVRVREVRIPAIGDKMASRAGQKGTIGLVIPEEDMPFTADGLRPDIIINPHAIPSRMTIGQLVECLLGNVCSVYGAYGDCTAFATKGSNYNVYGPMLTKMGYHCSGNRMFYSGLTGEQLEADVFFGPTYYMRLKHMVKDKINYRSRGPRTMLTRQTVQGRANDGGLRIGEMERDGIMAHGATAFLNDAYMTRGDEHFIAICNKTGSIAIYNESLNLFLSPLADGPIKFDDTLKGGKNIVNISRFGRSFSVIRVPYTFKLLMQELQIMNVQMRIITDTNVDQLTNMCFSKNVNMLLQNEERETTALINEYEKNVIELQKQTEEAGANYSQTPERVDYENFEYTVNGEVTNSLVPEMAKTEEFAYVPPQNQNTGWSDSPFDDRAFGTFGSPETISPTSDEELLQQHGNLVKEHGELLKMRELNKGPGSIPSGPKSEFAFDPSREQPDLAQMGLVLPTFEDVELQNAYNKLEPRMKLRLHETNMPKDKIELMLKRIVDLEKQNAQNFQEVPPENVTQILQVQKKDSDDKISAAEDKNEDKDKDTTTTSSSSNSGSGSNDKKVVTFSA